VKGGEGTDLLVSGQGKQQGPGSFRGGGDLLLFERRVAEGGYKNFARLR
jgi:hypothetical protein